MMSQPRMEIMDDAFRCSRATQVHMETPETVNLTEFCPRYNNEMKRSPCFHSGWMQSQDNNQTQNCC